MRCAFSFSAGIIATVYQFGAFEFNDTGITAKWLGDTLAEINYIDIIKIETTKSIFHWYKLTSHSEKLYIQPMFNKKFINTWQSKGFCINIVNRLD